jgi:hypothetical protein
LHDAGGIVADEGMQSGAIRDEIKWIGVTTPNHFGGILVINA